MKKSVIAALLVLGILIGLTGCGTYEVRFDPNGGTKTSGELLQEVKKGEDAVPPVVERDGYVFADWDHDPTNVQSDMVIAANWAKAYAITFDPDGGNVVSGDAVQYLTEGAAPKAPTVTKDGMSFVNWSPEVTSVSGDATYTAQWMRSQIDPEELYENVKDSVVEVTLYDKDGNQYALGSGFFTDDDGTVLTNYHVMEGAYAAKVTLAGGKTYDVNAVLDYNPDLDLALLETDVRDSEPIPFSSDAPKTGESIYAIGSSRGHSGTFTDGIVSTASSRFDGVDVDYIQHSAPISSGNSGGPLVNRYGDALGVNTMSLKDAQNMNYAVNINEFSNLNPNNRMPMLEFYRQTNADYLWGERVKEFIKPAEQRFEQESNDSWIQSNKLTLGEWTAGAISDEEDVDCFFVVVDSPRRVTLELVPNHTNEASELVALTARYVGDNEIDEDTVDIFRDSKDYSYTIEKVCVIDVPQAGIYCIGVTHDDDYEITEPYVYLIRAS